MKKTMARQTRDFEQPGRSMARSTQGMAATSHAAATLAAIQTLQKGGTAMDAAVAACAVQCVVEPGSTGIGGDCFALYAPGGSDRILAFDGSGRAPQAASVSALRAAGVDSIGRSSPHAITVPGAVDAWCQLLRDHGALPLAEVLAPAIALAEQGYVVAERAGTDWARQTALLAADENARRHLLIDGQAPAIGSVHRQPALAQTFRAIAAGGRDAFYRGPVAQDIVDYLRSLGGLHTLDDFAACQGNYVEPVSTTFAGHRVHECPPGGQGVIALMMLRLLEDMPAGTDPLDAERLFRELEICRLAYSVRDAVLGDPAGHSASADWLLSDELIGQLRAQLLDGVVNKTIPAFVPPPHSDTVYITVVDKDRNCASFINSVFHPFGSGRVSPATGVLLHNRGQSFNLTEGHPNAIDPGKRPMHTIIPGMVTRDGRVRYSFGVMGGHYQAMGHAWFLSRVLKDGMDMQSAMDLPRVFAKPGGWTVEHEATLPAATVDALRARGYEMVPPDWAIGGAQAIEIDWEAGTLTGASDHRKDGCALGY